MRYYLKGNCSRSYSKLSKATFLISVFLILVACLTICIPTRADGEVYDKVIRFHVIAESDSFEDQELKLGLRDAVIERYSEKLSSFSTKDAAYAGISKLTDEINDFAQEYIHFCGFDYTCKTELGYENYDRTEYESFTMPAGRYSSLRITIGKGQGKNWWCVLFPPMCTKAAMNTVVDPNDEDTFIEAGFTGEQYRIITNTDKPKYRIKFRLLEILFGK